MSTYQCVIANTDTVTVLLGTRAGSLDGHNRAC